MNDDDGELRLTIMATLAQNESKKTSVRVKAGQRISFQNGVIYGNGNILGYDKVGRDFVINEEQAQTVRMIYNMYLNGMGMRKIQFELEAAGRKTSTGLTRWYSSYISRVLNNPFYCGMIVYRKEYVPDYLEQKKVKNWGEVEQIAVIGSHKPIVTREEFEQVKTGSISTRKKRGLDIEGICDSPMVPRWKFESMADMIFQKFWKDRSGIIKIANEMLEDHYKDDREIDFQKEIEETKYKLEILDKKFDNLIDMRIAGEIDAAKFDEKKKALTDEKEKYEKILDSYQIDEEISDEEYNQRLQVLKYGLEKDFNFSTHSIPDEVIEAFVKEIIVYPDCFVWKLNIVDRDLKLKIAGRKKNPDVSLIESPAIGNHITGSNCQEERLIIVVSRLYIEASLEVH